MFEDSTFESAGKIRTRSRKWMLATFAFNGSILLALILIPLVYPQALPRFADSILVAAPPPPVDEPKPRPIHVVTEQARTQGAFVEGPSRIPRISSTSGPANGPDINVANLDLGGSGTADNPFSGPSHVTVVQAQPANRVRVASSIVEGLLLNRVTPAYPPLAQATGTQGTVILQATISARGSIENLRVVSGPVMLQQAALRAVQQWRYRPYLLNGQPVEVETTVSVVFRLDR
jgi:protein TonB